MGSNPLEVVSGPSIIATSSDTPRFVMFQDPSVLPASIVLPVAMSVAAAMRESFSEDPPCSNRMGAVHRLSTRLAHKLNDWESLGVVRGAQTKSSSRDPKR